MTETLVIFGASKNTGHEIALQARAAGHRVVALIRPGRDVDALKEAGVEIVTGDAFKAEDADAAFAAAGAGAIGVSTMGGYPGVPERPDYEANKVAIDAAVAGEAKRFIFVTTVGCGDSRDTLPPQVGEVLWPVADLKTKAEDHLKATGLPYTIIRPGHLLSEAASGDGILAEDPKLLGAIPRPELARLILRAIKSEETVGKTLAAAARGKIMSRGEVPELSLPA